MLQKKYLSQDKSIASYDYTDIASGTGYSIFYGANIADGTISGSYVLSDNAFYSDKVTTYANVPQAVTNFANIDFDVTFNMPRTAKGKVIVCVPVGIGRETGQANGVLTMNLSGSIIHYDGTTETNLGSFRSSDFALDDAVDAYGYDILSSVVDIAITHFKVGDTLRVSIEGWSRIGAAVTRYVGIGHDPKNQPDDNATGGGLTIYDLSVTTFGPTTMEVHVPFKIDV